MIYQSVKETALKCGVAESSIVRFCKAIGYSGYSELKTEVAKEAVSIQYQQEILKAENSDSFPEQLGQIFSSTVMLLDQARLQMDYDQIIRTADLILKSPPASHLWQYLLRPVRLYFQRAYEIHQRSHFYCLGPYFHETDFHYGFHRLRGNLPIPQRGPARTHWKMPAWRKAGAPPLLSLLLPLSRRWPGWQIF